jgi:hypothetical protein
MGGVVQAEGRSVIARTNKAESNLKDHKEKSRIAEGDQVLWASVGVIGGVVHTGRIAAGSNSGEAFLGDLGVPGSVLWSGLEV